MALFSERHGLQPPEPEIAVITDAPEELRGVLVDIAYEAGLDPHDMRTLVCRLLRRREDMGNWSAFPNVDLEVRGYVDNCSWYEIYDIIEAVYARLDRSRSAFDVDSDEPSSQQRFAEEINAYFRKRGIGWKLVNGTVQIRGSESFEAVVEGATRALETAGLKTSCHEIEEDLRDLSRKPEPDITGAIQHSLAALECVVRKVCEEEKPTLGQLLKRYPNLLPKPLDQAAEKLWSFASEQARHLREGRQPALPEAQLSVAIAAALTDYLVRRLAVSGAYSGSPP